MKKIGLSILMFLLSITSVSAASINKHAYTTADSSLIPSECSGMTFDYVIIGTSAADSIKGTNSRDLIIGNGAADSIKAGSGDDCIVTSAHAAATVTGEDGNDVIVGKGSGDSLKGGNGNDVITGHGAVTMRGEDGNDTLIDASGGVASYAVGGAGTDTCVAGKVVSCEQ